MYKTYTIKSYMSRGHISKLLFIMRLIIIILTTSFIQVYAASYAQKISIAHSNAPLKSVLKELRSQSGYNFVYTDDLLKMAKPVDIKVDEAEFDDVLVEIFKEQPLTYSIHKNTITVREKPIALLEDITENSKDHLVRGQVTGAGGETLPGVSVKIKGTLIGTSTDLDGRYSLNVPENATLVFTYIGYVAREVEVNNQSSINIVLEVSASALSEVVVTALGIKREAKSLTYSTQSVKSDQLAETREPNVMTALQGKVAGLTITEGGSGVGAPARVVLRGDRSFFGDSQPLYIVDGVPISGNPEQLSSDNIASINVLKGASAAALYGSAAQNGAIIITTHSGKAGKVKISLNNTYMVQSAIMSYEFQDVYGQGSGGKYIKNSENSWGPKMEGQMVDHWSSDPTLAGTQYAFSPQPGNVKDYFKNGHNQATNFLASVGSEKTQAMFGYTFTNAEGVLVNNGLKRHNASVRINSQLSEKLTLDSKLEYMRQDYDGGFTTNSYGNVGQIYSVPRNISTDQMRKFEYLGPDGVMLQNYWNTASTISKNPYWTAKRNLAESATDRVIGLASLTYKFSDELRFMVRTAVDGTSGNYENKLYNNTYNIGQFGYYEVGRNNKMEWNGDALLTYNKDIAKDLNISANVGGNINQRRDGSLSSNTGDRCCLIVPNLFSLSNTLVVLSNNNVGSPRDIQSVYAFGNISWKNSVFLDVTGRNDWSSTLPAASRSFFYPSVGLSVVLSDLIPSFPDLFSFAKVRASWAQVGNSTSPYMIDRYATVTGGGRSGFLNVNATLPNTELRPEKTESYEVGLDLRFLDGRLGFDVSAYKTNTRDQLFAIDLPIGSGASSYFTNGGDVENKGVEIQFSSIPIQSKNFEWNTNINFSANRNKVVEISDLRSSIIVGRYTLQEGQPFGNIYTKGFVRDSEGRVIVGNNGIPQITAGNTVLSANFNPDWMGSLSSTFRYKKLSLYFLVDHRQGGTMTSITLPIAYNNGTAKGTLVGREGGLVFGQQIYSNETAVTTTGAPNTIATTAEAMWLSLGSRTNPVGEAFIEDATNARLREISLGYTLPKKLLGKLPVSNVKFSLVGRNLFFLYRASKTLDVDVSSGTGPGTLGYDSYIRPTTNTFGGSLLIDF